MRARSVPRPGALACFAPRMAVRPVPSTRSIRINGDAFSP